MDCPICCEKFNQSTKKAVQCSGCQRGVCRKCIQKYLLETMTEPHCMFTECRAVWSILFIRQSLPKSFIQKEYQSHRTNMLFQRQLSLIPQTMPIIECQNQIYQAEEEVEKAGRAVIEAISHEQSMKERVLEYSHRWRQLRNNLIGGPNKEQQQIKRYQRPCPVEDCRAYLHPQTGKCDACSNTICLKCNLVLSKEEIAHVCKEEDVLQWKALMENTKPCPGCKTWIYKVSGCNQMWCSQCHTPFSWDTGRIERGPIHNPEYYEWMFGERREAPILLENQQHGLENFENEPVPLMVLRDTLGECVPHRPDQTFTQDKIVKWEKYVIRAHRFLNHLFDVTLPSMGNKIGNVQRFKDECLYLRTNFIRKKLSEKEFKRDLQRYEKAHFKARDYEQIVETLVQTWIYHFTQFCFQDYRHASISLYDIYQQLRETLDIANEKVRKLNQTYQSRLSELSIYSS